MCAAWIGVLRLCLVLGLVPCLGAVARAEDDAPLTPEEAAEAAHAALEAGDGRALERLALQDDPDPWQVADALCAAGRHDEAKRFAAAGPRPDTERLVAYVEGRRGRTEDAALLTTLRDAQEDLDAGRATEALLRVTAHASGEQGVRALLARALASQALMALQRFEDAENAARELAGAARALGWITMEGQALMRAGAAAHAVQQPARALEAWRSALALHDRRGDAESAGHTLMNIALAAQALGDAVTQRASYAQAAERFETADLRQQQVQALGALGQLLAEQGSLLAARGPLERALEVLVDLPGAPERGSVLSALGKVLGRLGEHERALGLLAEAQTMLEAAGVCPAAAEALFEIGSIHQRLGDMPRAREAFQGALALARRQGCARSEAAAHAYLGALTAAVGDLPKALDQLGLALRSFQALGDRPAQCAILAEMAEARRRLCDYVEAARLYGQARQLVDGAHDRARLAKLLLGSGLLHADLGDLASAQQMLAEALGTFEALGDPEGAAVAHQDLGAILAGLQQPEAARAHYEQALTGYERLKTAPAQARVLTNLAILMLEQADPAGAQRALDASQAVRRTLPPTAQDVVGELSARITQAEIHYAQKKPAEAEALLEKARGTARSLHALDALIEIHTLLAKAHLAQQRGALALETAQGAVQYLGQIARMQGESLGTSARSRFAELYAVGLEAAVAVGNVDSAITWLESGRAGALLEALGGPLALEAAALPPELRAAQAEAAAGQQAAYQAYLRELELGTRETRLAADKRLRAAEEELARVLERIGSERKAQARLISAAPAEAEDLQRWVAPDEALLLFGRAGTDVVAVVIEASTPARLVRLGSGATLQAAIEALHLQDAALDPGAALAALGKILLEPLALEARVKRLLVSPEGSLAYVPFAALDTTREVAYVPSGTTLGELLGAPAPQAGPVLALGDPDYRGAEEGAAARLLARGRRLRPLPGTRKEAQAVGTKVLVGPQATISGFVAALREKPRWRAVHLACHGIVHAERASLSALALTANEHDDGFLTALKVCELRLATDLAVLSACDTGRGTIVPGEGLVGLTRAFMLAGAPRVLCSLWKVDDEATSELMKRFYAYWNPKDGTAGIAPAAALRRAQAEIAGQERWRHPRFWAAWVLWGLPS